MSDKYDLSSIGAIAASAELARARANQEPSQDSYNAAWLHGYADALADAAKQLEPQQQLFDAIIGYMGEHNDSAQLYAALHGDMGLSDGTSDSLASICRNAGRTLPQGTPWFRLWVKQAGRMGLWVKTRPP